MKCTVLCILVFSHLLCFGQDTLTTYEQQVKQNNVSPMPGKSKFMIRGYYHSGFEATRTNGETNLNFAGGSINPILMYKQSDRLFFESEFEGEYEDGEFSLGLEYADMSFVLNKYITLRAGKFLLPFGAFSEKLHPAWINRMATKPLGFQDGGVLPESDFGFELRGACYLGLIKMNYQAYVINGPQLNDGSDDPSQAGKLSFGNAEDNNNNKSVGGRIGIFPFSNSMMEIGISGMTGATGTRKTNYQNVTANLFAADFALTKELQPIRSLIEIKAQYNYVGVGSANYAVAGDTSGLQYTFNNVTNSWYTQLSVRPSMVNHDFFRKLELVGRYSENQTPNGSLWQQHPTQMAIGLNFWLDWRTVLKFGYQVTNNMIDPTTGGTTTGQLYYIHWAMGF